MRTLMVLGMVAGLVVSLGAESDPHAVGFASSSDSFLIANAPATEGATIFNGDSVEAGATQCRVHMKNGNEITLAPHAAAQLYSDRFNVRKGMAEVRLSSGSALEAEGFVFKSVSESSQTRLRVEPGNITVSVLSGQADVSNLQGAILSRMVSGSSLHFAYASVPASESGTAQGQVHTQLLGVLDKQDGHYLLRDRYSNTVTELVGDIPSKQINELTLVYGTLEAKDSSIPHVHRILHVDRIQTSGAAAGLPCMPDGAGGVAKRLVLHGILNKDGNRYLITDHQHGTYEVIGDVDGTLVGKQVNMATFLLSDRQATAPAEHVVYAEHRKIVVVDSPCAMVVPPVAISIAALLSLMDSGAPPAHVPISY
jgi:hypothetical protein